MADLNPQTVTEAGLAPAFVAAAAGGDAITAPGDTVVLHVKNGGGAAINVTVDSVESCSQGGDHNLVVAVPAGGERLIGPITGRFAQVATGKANITYSAVATVTVAAYRL